MILLAGLSFSVAASTFKPPTEVKKNAGVTKVEKSNVVELSYILAPADLVFVEAVEVFRYGHIKSPTIEKGKLASYTAEYLDYSVRWQSKTYSNSNTLKDGYQRTRKIYLWNCCIRQC